MSNLAIKLEKIHFHDQQITVLNYNNKPYVAMKSIVENIGLDWHAQLNRINRHHVLSKGVVMIATPSKGGTQKYACLPISMINGWLFGIDTNRVKPEIRPNLEQYQLECFDVLYNHFTSKGKSRKLYLPSSQFTDDELCTLAWCYKAAERMRQQIKLVTEAMYQIKSEYAPSFYSMGVEYALTLENARVLLERETKHINPNNQGYLSNNWVNVLSSIKARQKFIF